MSRGLIMLKLQRLHRTYRLVPQPIGNVLERSQTTLLVCVPDSITHSYKQLANRSPDAAQGDLVTCLLQIAPDHIKYFLDNDKAGIPIPTNQNCALRELHRVAHVELGPLA